MRTHNCPVQQAGIYPFSREPRRVYVIFFLFGHPIMLNRRRHIHSSCRTPGFVAVAAALSEVTSRTYHLYVFSG